MVTERRWEFPPTYGSVNTEEKQWIKKTVGEGKKHQTIPPSGQKTTEKNTWREKNDYQSHLTKHQTILPFNDWLSRIKRQNEVAGIVQLREPW